jgi:WD40 repeat protein
MTIPLPDISRRSTLHALLALSAAGLAPDHGLAQTTPPATPATPAETPPAPADADSEWITAIGVSVDSRWLAAASTSHAIAIWEIATGKLLYSLEFPVTQNSVGALAFSLDAKKLFAGNAARRRSSKGKAIIAYDLESGLPLHEASADPDHVRQFEMSAKSNFVATIGGGYDRSLRLWGNEGLRLERVWPAHDSAVRSLAMSRDGRRLATGGSKGRRLGNDLSVRIWDTANARQLHKLAGHKKSIEAVSFTPDGRRLISASPDAIKLWAVDTGALIRSVSLSDDEVGEMTILSDGTAVAMLRRDESTEGYTVLLRATDNGRVMHRWPLPKQSIAEIAASPDSQLVFTGSDRSEVTMWDAKSGAVLRTFKIDEKAAAAARTKAE